jgi:hypothetical protein
MRIIFAFFALIVSFPALAQDITNATTSPTDPAGLVRTQASRNRDRTYVTDFCQAANLTGTIDNTDCIQSAVNALCTRSNAGGTLFFPASYGYAIRANTGVIVNCSGVTFEGDGWGDQDHSGKATIIHVMGAGSAAILKFAVPVSSQRAGRYSPGGGVRRLMIQFSNANSSISQTGPGVDFEHCEGCLVDNIRVWQPYVGIRNYAGLMNRVTQSQISQVINGGIGILITGSDAEANCPGNIGGCTGRSDIFTVDNTILDFQIPLAQGQHGADCIVIRDFAATNWLSHVACNGPRRGIQVDCPSSQSFSACPMFITAFDFENEADDHGVGDGENIHSEDFAHFVCTSCQLFGYSVIANIEFTQNRFRQSGDAQVMGGRIGYAHVSCIVSAVDQVYIGGGLSIQGCGQSGPGYYGVDLRNPPSGTIKNSATVQGVDFCRDPSGMTAPTSMGGVILYGGMDWNIVSGNRFRACAAGVTDSSGGTHNTIVNNAGP